MPYPSKRSPPDPSPADSSSTDSGPVDPHRRRALILGGPALIAAAVPSVAERAAAPSTSAPGKDAGPARPEPKLAPPSLALLALSRLAYGPRATDWNAWNALPGQRPEEKLRSWLECQLDPAKIDDAASEARLASLETLRKPYAQLWKEHYAGLPDNDSKYPKLYQPTDETRLASILRKTYSERQMLERMTEFWHDHFNVNPGHDDIIAPLFGDYDRTLRSGALGNFFSLLTSVAQHPAMLKYPDNASSSHSGPNENYARELFELHTLGAENYLGVGRQKDVPGFYKGQPSGYVDEDVYEATRAFTGWRMNNNLGNDDWQQGVGKDGTFLYYAAWHDRFHKTVLGRDLPPDQAPRKDGLDVLAALASHPGTARYIVRKLVRRLVADDPPQSLVDAAAQTWLGARKAPDQIAQTLRTIVLSAEFARTWGAKQKRPLELFVSAARALNADLKVSFDVTGHLDWMGQLPHGWPAPNGYPDVGAAWRSSTVMLRAWQTLGGMAKSEDERWKSSVVAESKGRKRPNELTDFWLLRLFGHKPLAVKAVMRDILRGGGDPDAEIADAGALEKRLKEAVGFALMSPEFFRT